MKDTQLPVVYHVQTDSSYDPKKRDTASPYYMSYWAAWLQRPVYDDPVEPIITYPKPRRTAFVILIAVLMAALIAVFAISYLKLLPELSLFHQINVVDDAADDIDIGFDDIVNGTLKSFSIPVEGEPVFYAKALSNIDNVEMSVMISYYAIPASIALSLLIAVYILIKSIMSLTNDKRRKFPYIALVLLLFTLLGVVGGIVWNAQPLASVMGFVTGSGTNLVLGYGYYAIIGIEILALIFSLFAYKSKELVKKQGVITGYRKLI